LGKAANRRRRPGAAAGLLLVLVATLVPPARAAPGVALPALFSVRGVAPGDVLNVRAEPNASAEIVGALTADATGIEVVGLDPTGRWARVNAAERSGWAATRYLAAGPGLWEAGGLPAGLRCFGTEPFWSLAPDGDAAVFATPEAPDRALRLASVLDTGAPADPRRALIAEGDDLRLTASIVPAVCSDGMSDRAYGLAAAVILEGGGTPALLAGCCSVAP
jgi:uncharacterized membrane protein